MSRRTQTDIIIARNHTGDVRVSLERDTSVIEIDDGQKKQRLHSLGLAEEVARAILTLVNEERARGKAWMSAREAEAARLAATSPPEWAD